MKICIVGGGAIGSIIAFHLYRAGASSIDVYYGSLESVREVQYNGGITVVYKGKEYLVPVNPRHYMTPGYKCDIVVNAVKAYDVPKTIDLIKTISHENTLVVSIQNGFGSYEYLVEKLGCHRVAIGIVFYGAIRVSRSLVKEAGVGEIILGQKHYANPLLMELMEMLKRGGCPARITSNIDWYRWLKLAINSVINPITAITRKPNRIVYENPYARELAKEILEELARAAKYWSNIDLDVDRLLNYVIRIAKTTKENYSSMLQDVLAGRRTEIDYINGWITKVLEEIGVEHSVNKIITKIIHTIENTQTKTT
ncbi:2-dehydropantoate 2-reductase [Desulfurococcaceae archaeon MEX13E-LK6-19]|nr:2-dehydropantoate 2-reductase [Desulfurococcaceae archaeon MEX13E-LK6-19]